MTLQPPGNVTDAPTRSRAVALDAACAEAVDLAMQAAVAVAGAGQVGQHLGVAADDERVATHRFASLAPAYTGWEWSVTVARASRAKAVTVDEVCLLPGPDALLAPAWLPYAERLRPGDLGPGDLLPVPAGDDRLEPGWTGGLDAFGDDPGGAQTDMLAWELGLARNRVLSVLGLDDATDRWLNGAGGPHAALAQAAPAHCETCGFLQPLRGLLGHAFGVCANEHSPSDGHVVTMDHGCGAHSEAGQVLSLAAAAPVVLDSVGFDELTDDSLPAGRQIPDRLITAAPRDVESADVTPAALHEIDEIVPLEDLALEDLALEGLALEGLAVEDLAVGDLVVQALDLEDLAEARPPGPADGPDRPADGQPAGDDALGHG